MKKVLIVISITIGMVLVLAFSDDTGSFPTLTPAELSDSLEKDRAKYIALVKEMIKGKEKVSSDSVYKNIQILKGMPADRLLAVMNTAYSKSLGVSCGHCHNTGAFESEEKHQKQIAREMILLTRQTRDLLKKVNGLPEGATINCTTCHRGQLVPALDLPKQE